MRIDIYHHIVRDDATERFQREVLTTLRQLARTGEMAMASLDDVLAEVAECSTKEDSLIALAQGLRSQLADALANVAVPPEAQAKIDQVFAQLQANAGKVDSALNENVTQPQGSDTSGAAGSTT